MKSILKTIAQKFGYDILHLPTDPIQRQKNNLFDQYKINLIFDIGANTGQFAQRAIKAGFKGKIVSFEPLPDAFHKLQFSAKLNNNWDAENCAIGDYDGKTTLNISQNSYSSSILPILGEHITSAPESVYVDRIEVEIKKIDTIIYKFYNENKNLYIKIDTQGFERNVFEGCLKSLDKICGFQMELSLVPLYEGETLMQEMITLLRQYGYKLKLMESGHRNYETGELLQVECYFFK